MAIPERPDPPLPKPFPKALLALPAVLLAVLALLYGWSLSIDPSSVPSKLMNKPLPNFSLTALKDMQRLVTEKDLQGPALVNVWASWCIACREENPQLLALRDEGVTIYGVDYLDARSDATAWLEREGNPFHEVVFDPEGKLGQALDLFGAPETYVIDSQNIVRYRHVGSLTPVVIGKLREVLNEKGEYSR